MIDLSRQQRWVIITIICAFITGGVILTAQLGQRSAVDVYSLEEQVPQLSEEAPDAAAETEDAEPKTETVCFVHVCGAVQKPGVYQLAEGTRCFQAIEAAGGAKTEADTAAINLAARVVDGEQIYLPRRGETTRNLAKSSPPQTRSTGKNQQAKPSWPLDLNTATAAQLEEVPGIGPAMASRILNYRSKKGRFNSLDQLTEVPGIGDKRLAQLRSYLCVR